MRAKFHDQLNQLDVELMQMGTLCEDAIHAAVRVLMSNKEEKIKKVRTVKVELEDKGREIEDHCMQMLIQQQPVARDLNTISYSLKMIRDMDRIGSQAVELASIARDVIPEKMQCAALIHAMTDTAVGMVTDSVSAFVSKDTEIANAVIIRDDKLDDEYLEVKNTLSNQVLTEKGDVGNAIDILMIAKYLERIGDHAVNIATWVRDIVEANERRN
ncbi:MAG: phosphate signaling complex protein PhoU [Eubacteriaceae bacterium]|jgi:phosphate transport system protein